MPRKIRKHSAKVLSIVRHDGDVNHYVLVGGRWFYNGRKKFKLSDGATKDGFWLDPILEIISRGNGYTAKELANFINSTGGSINRKLYIREWESCSCYGSEAPF